MPGQDLEKQPNYTIKLLKMEPGIPENRSLQNLVDAEENVNSDISSRSIRDVTYKEWITVIILCFVNLINYMDRFTLAGILTDIQTHFNIDDSEGGLLQTAFILSYMVFAPIFGYLGDRYSRRNIMAFGVFLWSLTTLIGSFMNNFSLFVLFRALVGIGEASYSTIAPTIISDLFVKDVRSKMLALFYFAIPVGSGMGYIIGSETASAAGQWQWGLRVTPILGAIAVLLIIFVLKDPNRGESEGAHDMGQTTWLEDVRDIVKNPSFVLSTAGFTCVAFVAGALSWWGPKFIYLGIKLQPGSEDIKLSDVSYKFGIIAMISGLLGVPAGSAIAQMLRSKHPNIDPIVCGFGILMSSPLVFISCITAATSAITCYVFIFFAEIFINLTWSLVADILLVSRSHFMTILSFPFGGITMLAGVCGLTIGCFLSQWLIKRYPRVDPIICGAGLICSAPFLMGCAFMAPKNSYVCFILLFFGQVSLNLNWAIVGDILLYVVVPTRRSTAEGFQLLVSHALGDAGSPYLIGIISDALRIFLTNPSQTTFTTTINTTSVAALQDVRGGNTTDVVQFKALQYALFTTCFVEVLGGIFFLVNALYIVKDRMKVDRAVKDAADMVQSSRVLVVNETERRTLMS